MHFLKPKVMSLNNGQLVFNRNLNEEKIQNMCQLRVFIKAIMLMSL